MRDWKKWFCAAGIRALKTMAQTAVGVIGAAAVLSEVNWMVVLSASVLSGIVSLLTSIAGIPEEKTTEVYFCNGDADAVMNEEVDE